MVQCTKDQSDAAEREHVEVTVVKFGYELHRRAADVFMGKGEVGEKLLRGVGRVQPSKCTESAVRWTLLIDGVERVVAAYMACDADAAAAEIVVWETEVDAGGATEEARHTRPHPRTRHATHTGSGRGRACTGAHGMRLPACYEVVDAELHAILMALSITAAQHDAGTRRVLVMSDCLSALRMVERGGTGSSGTGHAPGGRRSCTPSTRPGSNCKW
jgi:hypothetical protein